MVAAQMAEKSVAPAKGKTEQIIGGNSTDANRVEEIARQFNITPDDARQLMVQDTGPSIVSDPYSAYTPGVEVYAVPYPEIEVQELPVLDMRPVTLAQTDGGFWRGLSGDKRSVFEAPAPLSENIGSGVRSVLGGVFVDPVVEVANQYRDLFHFATGGSTDGWRSNVGQAVLHGEYGSAALTEVGTVAGAAPLAGAALKGVAWTLPAAGPMAESYAAKTGLVSYAVENTGLSTAAEVGAGTRQSGYVFRGDGRAPDVIFEEGFRTQGLNQDIYRYATENVESVFVSASKSPTIAREFASYQGEGYVYTIRAQPAGVDVNAVLGTRSPFPHELEVAIPGGVRSSEIMGGRYVGPDGSLLVHSSRIPDIRGDNLMRRLVDIASHDGRHYSCWLDVVQEQRTTLTAHLPFACEQQFVGQNLFEALNGLRLYLEEVGCLLLCNVARRDTYPSRAVRQMGGGFKVYVLHEGQQAKLSDLVDALDPAELNSVASVAEQRAAYEAWLRSL